MNKKTVAIIGAGPAGLTAGYLLAKKGFAVTILEMDEKYLGGISRTVEYKGFRFDIGGHRFFSKNEDVNKFWDEILKEEFIQTPRLSRWYYRGKFFHYPIRPFELLKVFGILESVLIVSSYLKAKIFPIKPEVTLADWCINNFGKHLATPFFINYNKKLWGINPSKLSKDFTLQRIKGVSFTGTILNSIKSLLKIQDKTSKSFIETFKYPKLGPGMLWEKVGKLIELNNGKIVLGAKVTKVVVEGWKVGRLEYVRGEKVEDCKVERLECDYVLSSMPLKELIHSIEPEPSKEILKAADNLCYRDFITVALMIDKEKMPPDNWIYTHDEHIKAIRIQLYKNWSKFMVPDKSKSCIGFEYVCLEGDELWSKSDKELIELAKSELEFLGFANDNEIIDGSVVRMKNVYPMYLLDYSEHVNKIKHYLQNLTKSYSLQPMGRCGLHRYNNSDHSMMTAFLCVKNILGEGNFDQWIVNSDAEYHEEETFE